MSPGIFCHILDQHERQSANAGHLVSLGGTTNAKHETSSSPSQKTILSPKEDEIDPASIRDDVHILACEEATSREDRSGG